MKIRHKGSSGSDKIELQMTPMIDIVFQLLVFFILTFKVVAQEGDFNVRMPVMGAPETVPEEAEKTTLRVRMQADAEGNLARLLLDNSNMTGDTADAKFASLQGTIRNRIGDGGGPAASTTEVEFECDYGLKYENVVGAITAVSGYVKRGAGGNDEIIKLIEQIKFAQPKNKPAE